MTDDITTLIAEALVRGHAAPKATPEHLASRTQDFLPLAARVRDALAAEGWLNDGEEQAAARQVLDLQDVQKLLRDKVARMVAAEREKHVADGQAQERRLWLEGKGVQDDRDRLYALLGDVVGALKIALSAPIETGKRETCERILARAKEVLT